MDASTIVPTADDLAIDLVMQLRHAQTAAAALGPGLQHVVIASEFIGVLRRAIAAEHELAVLRGVVSG